MERLDGSSNGVYQGRDPQLVYDEAVAARPVPAIEKPLGPRAIEPTTEPVVLIDNLGGLENWSGEMSGTRPWTG